VPKLTMVRVNSGATGPKTKQMFGVRKCTSTIDYDCFVA